MTKIKICGIRRIEDCQYLNEFKPDYAGFILSKPFWRCIDLNKLSELDNVLSKQIKRVGVFVNETVEYILQYTPLLDIIQLHGDETENFINDLRAKTDCEIWKAIRVKSADEINKTCKLPVDKLLIDSYSDNTYGGSGKVANWDLIKDCEISKPFLLAGGISADNCSEAVNSVKPFGLDISSSVETDKVKDSKKIKEIISLIRNHDRIIDTCSE